jgi:hypothetical protein
MYCPLFYPHKALRYLVFLPTSKSYSRPIKLHRRRNWISRPSCRSVTGVPQLVPLFHEHIARLTPDAILNGSPAARGGIPSHDRQTCLGTSITPYCVFLLENSLRILRCVDGVITLELVYDWEKDWEKAPGEWETPGGWDWHDTTRLGKTLLLASESLEDLPWILYSPFWEEEQKLDPWASRLSKQEIRLFAMELDDKHEITGTLLDFGRSECPQYTALSYVCGQGSCDQEIYVNGGFFCVKPNLLAALKQLKSCMICRIRDEARPPRDMLCWVWVDAMSINQADATEKAEQIGEMHHVYRNATRVAVCLGHLGSDFGCVARIIQWAKGVRHPKAIRGRRCTQSELVEQLQEFDVSPGNL